MTRRSPSLRLITLLAYTGCIALVTFGLFRVRTSIVDTYGTDSAQTNWQQWREGAVENDGPVKRREPTSELPPAYVLMKDHFRACLGFSLMMTTVLFLTMVLMIRGAFFYEQPAAYQTEPNGPED